MLLGLDVPPISNLTNWPASSLPLSYLNGMPSAYSSVIVHPPNCEPL